MKQRIPDPHIFINILFLLEISILFHFSPSFSFIFSVFFFPSNTRNRSNDHEFHCFIFFSFFYKISTDRFHPPLHYTFHLTSVLSTLLSNRSQCIKYNRNRNKSKFHEYSVYLASL